MSDYKPHGRSTERDPRDGEPEYRLITGRSSDALRRAAVLDKDWDELATALDQTGLYGTEPEKFSLMIHLLQLSPRLHEADLDQQSIEANSYAQIERKAIILLLRKRALEDELFSIHEEFHLWAEEYGVELVNETVDSPADLGEPRMSGGFGAVPLPPDGHVLNTHTCRLSGRFWKESRKYCKIKDATLFG